MANALNNTVIQNVNGKAAVRLHNVVVKISLNVKAFMVDWQGVEIWIPKTVARDNGDGTMDVQEWFYNKRIDV